MPKKYSAKQNSPKPLYTSAEKYTSHTLFERVIKGLRKGWCWLCVRGDLETEQTATYWPQVPLYYSSTSSFCWAAQLGSWEPKPSVWNWPSLQHLVPNCNRNSNCDCNSNWTLPALDFNLNFSKLTPTILNSL